MFHRDFNLQGFITITMAKLTYKDAGLDLDVYNQAMKRLPGLMEKTNSPRVMKLPQGFAGLFQLDFDSPLMRRNYEDPVLISCTDGVGTKLKVANLVGKHDTVGIDLVAMSVNDAICCGAEPLFFLDYVAMDKDNPPLLEQIVSGITDGCVQANCALLGGETAIMPDLYAPGEYDLAGFCVGVASKKNIIDGKKIVKGDVAIGVASTGLHSNGFSLVRKIVFDAAGLKVEDYVEELGKTVGEALITPTRIYVKPVRKLLADDGVASAIHGIAHITGGGLQENTDRIIPEGLKAVFEEGSWPVPPLFTWLQKLGEVEDAEMARVFNRGLGLVVIVSPEAVEGVRQSLKESGCENWIVGKIE